MGLLYRVGEATARVHMLFLQVAVIPVDEHVFLTNML